MRFKKLKLSLDQYTNFYNLFKFVMRIIFVFFFVVLFKSQFEPLNRMCDSHKAFSKTQFSGWPTYLSTDAVH